MVQTSISAWLNKPNSRKQYEFQPREKTAPSASQQVASTSRPAGTNSNIAIDDLPSQSIEPSGQEQDIESSSSPKQSKKNFRIQALSLPSNASLSAITSEYIDAYTRMTALLLPIPYPKNFFEEILDDPDTANICFIALWTQPSGINQQNPTQKVVSGIRCRLLARSPALPQARNQPVNPEESLTLYIAALTTLAPYRRHRLASALFHRVLSRAVRDYGITTVTAHRWEANEEAQGWYESQGFKEVGFVSDYYRRLKPSGAFILERKVGAQDHLLDVGEQDGKVP